MSQIFSVQGPASGAPALPPGIAWRSLNGALFFGAVGKVEGLAEQLPAGTRRLVLDLDRLFWMDTSGLDALEQLHRQLARQGIGLRLVGAQGQALSLIRRSGFAEALGADAVAADRAAALAEASGAMPFTPPFAPPSAPPQP
jgi:sulfate permease, SulP family